jgi:hypothetical protein
MTLVRHYQPVLTRGNPHPNNSKYLIPFRASNPFTGTVIFVGDSILAGDNLNTPPVWNPMVDFVDAPRVSYNHAIGGRFLSQIDSDLSSAIAAHPDATAVVFNGGSNNVGGVTFSDPDTMVSEAQAVFAVAAAAGLPCIFFGIMPFEGLSPIGYSYEEAQAVTDEFNARMALWCNQTEGAWYFDAYSRAWDATRPLNDYRPPGWDAVGAGGLYFHMTDLGNNIMGKALSDFMRSPRPDPVATRVQAILDTYSNLTAAEENAIASFLYRQMRLDNWQHVVEMWAFQVADSSEYLQGLNGTVATLGKTGGHGGSNPTHTAGDGVVLNKTGATHGNFVDTGFTPADLCPGDATGYSLGVLPHAVTGIAGAVHFMGASNTGSLGITGSNGALGINVVTTPNVVSGELGTTFSFPTVQQTGMDEKFLGAVRTGALDTSMPITVWVPQAGTPETSGNYAGGTSGQEISTANIKINGKHNDNGAVTGMFDWTCAVAFLGREGINLKQLAPEWTTAPRGGIELLYQALS